jgi:hypothetical protein
LGFKAHARYLRTRKSTGRCTGLKTKNFLESNLTALKGQQWAAKLEKSRPHGCTRSTKTAGLYRSMPTKCRNGRQTRQTVCRLYETVTEGTPISPVADSPEALAQWLTDNKASVFADHPASYDAWLKVFRGSPAISLVVAKGGIITGIDGEWGSRHRTGRIARFGAQFGNAAIAGFDAANPFGH